MVEEKMLGNDALILANNLSENCGSWHPGVIGIVASRIKEKYNRPTAVIAFEDGVGKASARSINGVDLGAAIIKAREEGLLVAGGGHKMAAGFTVAEAQFPEFQKFILEYLKSETEQALKNQICEYDYDFAVSGLNVDLCKELEILAPYGTDNREPSFVISNCRIVNSKIMAEKHLKLILADNAAGIYDKSIEAILWKAVDTPFLEIIENNPRANFSFLGSIKINKWQDRERVQFIIDDVKL